MIGFRISEVVFHGVIPGLLTRSGARKGLTGMSVCASAYVRGDLVETIHISADISQACYDPGNLWWVYLESG